MQVEGIQLVVKRSGIDYPVTASPVGGETHSGEQGGLPHPVSSKA